MRIVRFAEKDLVFGGIVEYEGKECFKAITEQGGEYYITSGRKITNGHERHYLNEEEVASYRRFVMSELAESGADKPIETILESMKVRAFGKYFIVLEHHPVKGSLVIAAECWRESLFNKKSPYIKCSFEKTTVGRLLNGDFYEELILNGASPEDIVPMMLEDCPGAKKDKINIGLLTEKQYNEFAGHLMPLDGIWLLADIGSPNTVKAVASGDVVSVDMYEKLSLYPTLRISPTLIVRELSNGNGDKTSTYDDIPFACEHFGVAPGEVFDFIFNEDVRYGFRIDDFGTICYGEKMKTTVDGADACYMFNNPQNVVHLSETMNAIRKAEDAMINVARRYGSLQILCEQCAHKRGCFHKNAAKNVCSLENPKFKL